MKKFNVGILLIIITIISFIIFIIIDSKVKEKDMNLALKYINKYYEVYSKYACLPEEFRDIQKQMDEKDYNMYLMEMKEELSKYVLDTQLEMIYEEYKKRLDYQYKGRITYNKYEITDIEYNKDENSKVEDGIVYAYIKYKCKTVLDKRESSIIDKKTDRYIGTINENVGEIYEPTTLVMLKKMEDGEFKVVFDVVYTYYN